MLKKFMDIIRSILPLEEEKKRILFRLSEYLDKIEIKQISKLVKLKKIDFEIRNLDVSPQILTSFEYPYINLMTDDKDIKALISQINNMVYDKIKIESYYKFAPRALAIIPKFIAMNIEGFDQVKKAVSIQLFSKYTEPIHILLMGDSGVGKTDILRSITNISPISSFGLGSGTTGMGLTATVKGKDISKGMIPLADKGICVIDELELMKERDRNLLYDTMEKGIFNFDFDEGHQKFDARVKVIATTQPKGDRFVGWTLNTLKRQVALSQELISKFHFVFMIRKPDIKRYVETPKKVVLAKHEKIISPDEKFISDYIDFAENIEVELPDDIDKEIINIAAIIKMDEKKYFQDVSPTLIIGLKRIAKAAARMRLSKIVQMEDMTTVKEIVVNGLKLYD